MTRALLRELLPDGGVTRLVHPQPQYRDWPVLQGSSPDDAYQAYRDVAALAIEDARSDPGRCAQVIPKINAMPSEERPAFSTLLASLPVTDALVRRRLFEALNEFVVLRRQFADEPWALAGEEDELARIAETFTPERAVDRHWSLFAERWPHYWHHNPGWDIELAQARADAVQEIIAEDGIEALIVLADETLNGDLIGAALPEQADDTRLLSRPTGEQHTLAFEYFAVRMRETGHSKREELLERTSTPEQRALSLLATRDPRWAWTQLKKVDGFTSDAYWRRFPISGLGQDFDGVAEAAAGLNSVSRFAAALQLIMIYSTGSESDHIAQETAIACDGFIGSQGVDPGDGVVVSRYDLQVIVSLLAKYQDVIGRRRVVEIELGLSSRVRSLNLSLPATSALLEEDPRFYAELVVTESRGESPDAQTAAYQALMAFTRCPGASPDGSLDAQILRVRVDKVRELLEAEDLQKLGDEMIAKILVHALPPSLEEIGDLLEDIRSKDLDQGVWMALYNRRGLTSRGLTDGGTQELTLAEEYEHLALQAQDAPRLQRILRSLAEKYRNEGREPKRRGRGGPAPHSSKGGVELAGNPRSAIVQVDRRNATPGSALGPHRRHDTPTRSWPALFLLSSVECRDTPDGSGCPRGPPALGPAARGARRPSGRRPRYGGNLPRQAADRDRHGGVTKVQGLRAFGRRRAVDGPHIGRRVISRTKASAPADFGASVIQEWGTAVSSLLCGTYKSVTNSMISLRRRQVGQRF